MKPYNEFVVSSFDHRIPLEEREYWLVASSVQTRDSGPMARSNFKSTLEKLENTLDYTPESVEKHRIGHYAIGWYEIILVEPGSAAASTLKEVDEKLQDYCLVNEDNYQEELQEEALLVWKQYGKKSRLEYMRKKLSSFGETSLKGLLGMARGEFFLGDAMDLVEDYGN